MSLGDLSDLCSVMHESNSNMLQRVEVILRQYGYKGPSPAPTSVSVPVPDPSPPAVVEHDNDEIVSGPEEETPPIVIEDDEDDIDDKLEDDVVEEDEAEPDADFLTPPKPGSSTAAAKTSVEPSPETPPTPTFETLGLTEVSKSVLRGESSTSKLESLQKLHRQQVRGQVYAISAR